MEKNNLSSWWRKYLVVYSACNSIGYKDTYYLAKVKYIWWPWRRRITIGTKYYPTIEDAEECCYQHQHNHHICKEV